ncbi:MAG: hypothetical protein GDA36_13635 [Rhodobacteraceae bacterium]|nr:hypothetical protein [Paracoccaceae bacterium]
MFIRLSATSLMADNAAAQTASIEAGPQSADLFTSWFASENAIPGMSILFVTKPN